MKRTVSLLLVLTAAGLQVACRDDSGSSVQTAPATSSPPPAAQMDREVRDAARAAENRAGQGKEEVTANASNRLARLDVEIADLKLRAKDLKDDAKVEVDRAISRLEEQRQVAGRRLDEVRGQAGEAWVDIKKGLADALGNLESAIADARKKLATSAEQEKKP